MGESHQLIPMRFQSSKVWGNTSYKKGFSDFPLIANSYEISATLRME